MKTYKNKNKTNHQKCESSVGNTIYFKKFQDKLFIPFKFFFFLLVKKRLNYLLHSFLVTCIAIKSYFRYYTDVYMWIWSLLTIIKRWRIYDRETDGERNMNGLNIVSQEFVEWNKKKKKKYVKNTVRNYVLNIHFFENLKIFF